MNTGAKPRPAFAWKRAMLCAGIALLVAAAPASAAVSGDRIWARRANGGASQADRGTGIAIDPSGNVVVTGSSEVHSVDGYLTAKYDSAGRVKWSRRYDSGGGDSLATHVVTDKNSNVYVTGHSWQINRFKDDIVTIKYDRNGKRIWLRRYDGPAHGDDVPAGVAVDSLGNVYVAATSAGYRPGALDQDDDILTLMYSPSGALKWHKLLQGVTRGQDGAAGLALDKSRNVLVAGFSYNSAGNADFLIAKYTPAGTRKWMRRYDGVVHGTDIPVAIGVDSASSVYVTGRTPENTMSYPPTDILTVKYNSAGTRRWAQVIGLPDRADGPSDLAIDRSNNVLISGFVHPGTNDDFLVLKYDTNGNMVWDSEVDMSDTVQTDDNATSVAVDSAGHVYATGSSTGSNTDYLTVKFERASGNALWHGLYDGPGANTDWAYDIAVGSGGCYVSGSSFGGDATNYDFATIKYAR